MKRFLFAAALLAMSFTASAVSLVSVKSCATHGVAGAYCQTVSGNAIEPRFADANGHVVVFEFDTPLDYVPDVFALYSNAQHARVTSVVIADRFVTVNIVPIDGSNVTFTLDDVNGSATPFTQSIGYLIGDLNGDGIVSQADVDAVKLLSGNPTNASNFFGDVNLSGAITASDISAVKARLGHFLQ